MKTLSILFLALSLFLVACEKDYCIIITAPTGDNACEKCFRTQKKLDNFTEKYAPFDNNYEEACAD